MKRFDKSAPFVGQLAIATTMLLACSKPAPTPPGGFGVNLTIDATKLSSTALKTVADGLLVVSGAETQIKQFPVVPQISSGQLTFSYIPASGTTGSLSFEFDALGGSGAILGSGSAGPIKLVAGEARPATITLTPASGTSEGLGSKCTANAVCASGFCTDGVCCESACTDVCANCALKGTAGLCTGYPAGTDPENECAGSSTMTGTGGGKGGGGGAGGSNADGGTNSDAATDAETIVPPDGGIVATPATCGGTCNGMKACAAFAMAGSSCGTPFCNTRKDLANLTCDGKGTCGIGLTDCMDGYTCDFIAKPAAACRTTCNANADCLANYYCNGTTNACAGTKSDSLTCATDAECTSGHCAIANGTGVCCNTACDSPNSCNNAGAAGKCQCPGVTCGANVACQIFYQDADGDGYGNKSGTIALGTAAAGCAGTPPAGFVADNTDCDDKDANVHPGQTGWFGTASKGIGTFDYDCDGTLEKDLAEYPGGSCTFCPTCSVGCGTATSGTCGSATAQASLACTAEGGICLTTLETAAVTPTFMSVPATSIGSPIIIKLACCGCDDHAGFTKTVDCGQSAAYVTCGTCGAASGGIGSSGGTATTSVSTQQLCH